VCYTSGQIGLDPATAALVPGGIQAQTRRAIENLQAVLRAGGYGLHQVVKTTVFLTTMDDFAAMNEVYGTFWKEPFPARSTVAVAGLPKGALVEIEAIAVP
jgi:2-iminobutanoate/2-iminopropanoate deaminase